MILTGLLEKPYCIYNLCDYFYLPGRGRRKLGTLAANNHEYEAAGRRLTTEMPYSFQARSWRSGTV